MTAAAATASLLLGGCAEGVDQAHSVQTRLGRIVQVVAADVTVATPDSGARIAVTVAADLSPEDVVRLAQAVDAVAAGESYPSYRLELREAGEPDDVLVVDDAFAAAPGSADVVVRWRRVTNALLGPVALTHESGRTSVRVAAGAGLAHDVTEASRIRPTPARTAWRFDGDGGTVLLDGQVTTPDVGLVQLVQRTVVSPSLAVPAEGWRLERRRAHLQLDLEVDPARLAPGGVPAADLTARRWGARLAPLARVAVAALEHRRTPARHVVRLWQRTGTAADGQGAGTDVLAWWTADRPPARGRDRFVRGWDAWLAAVARGVRRG